MCSRVREISFVCLSSRPAHIRLFFFFNDTATTEIYTLSLHDALPIYGGTRYLKYSIRLSRCASGSVWMPRKLSERDRESTRLNSSHSQNSYAVFCLKKKKKTETGAPM